MPVDSSVFTQRVFCYPFRGEGFDAEFLILKKASGTGSTQAGLWQVVSGKRTGEETHLQGALRELEEETGCRPVRFYNAGMETYYDHFRHVICLCPTFAAQIPHDAEVKLSNEHDEYCWLPFDEALPRLPWPSQRESIGRIRFNIVDPAGPVPMEIPEGLWQKS